MKASRTTVVQSHGIDYLNSLAQWKGQGGFTLDSMAAVLEKLQNPQNSFRSIHVTGTNGKGSVGAMLSGILGAEGHKVGLTTSPHLIAQNERILIDGMPISDEKLNFFALQVYESSKASSVKLSYFEAITATAFLAFREEQVEYAVIEVGLGGRLDATNLIMKPDACVIVSIALDHTKILGEQEVQIAREKAGIFKEDTIAILGYLSANCANEAIEIAKKKHVSKIRRFGSEFNYEHTEGGAFQFTSMHESKIETLALQPSLLGSHQLHNATVAAEVALQLNVSKISIEQGIQNSYWPGRLEWIDHANGSLLLDCAHNSAGMNSLISYLDSSRLSSLTALFGVLERHDWKLMVDELIPFVAKWYLKDPPTDRAVSSKEVAEYLKSKGIQSDIITEFHEYFQNVKGQKTGLVSGSIYLVGAFKKYLKEEQADKSWQRPIWIRKEI